MKYYLKTLLLFCGFVVPASIVAQAVTEEAEKIDYRLVLTEASQKIAEYYIFPEVAQEVSAQLLRMATTDHYQGLAPEAFAESLSADLVRLGNDRHFNVLYRPTLTANNMPEKEQQKIFNDINRNWNFGFEEVMRLSGNIGYVRYTGFCDAKLSALPLEATMNFVSNTSALIIDLRENNGGDSETTLLFISYFFPQKQLLSKTYYRHNDDTTRSWTKKKVSGNRYLNKPVYILTGAGTISAAEALAYELQQNQIAIVVGEGTYGAANPVKAFSIHGFLLFVPVGQTINTITQSNWEHTGVVPDVASENALTTAHILALKTILQTEANTELSPEEIKAQIQLLEEAEQQ